jgi:hypothetical protein
MDLTQGELADRAELFASAIERVEANADELETWTLDLIDDLADASRLPVQLLLRLRCPSCGR